MARNVIEDTFGALWAWRISENADWARAPEVAVEVSRRRRSADIGGLGDVKVATGGAFRLSKTCRIGGGLDLAMPTGRQ